MGLSVRTSVAAGDMHCSVNAGASDKYRMHVTTDGCAVLAAEICDAAAHPGGDSFTGVPPVLEAGTNAH